jgi:hypothetical protein
MSLPSIEIFSAWSRRRSSLLLGIASVLALVACSDDRDNEAPASAGKTAYGGSNGSAGAPDQAELGGATALGAGAAPSVDEEPMFLLGTRIWDASQAATSYFHLVTSLDEGTSVEAGAGLEVAGAAKLYSVEGIGWFAIGGGESPTITRYQLDEAGKLTPQGTISLLDYGISNLWDTLYVVSPTKMYYPDRDGQRLIIINPSTMEIEGDVDLPETNRDGFLSLYSYASLRQGRQLLFSVAWIDWNETDSILGETGLVVLDTETDSVSRFDVDPRCGGITQPVVSSSGDVYFASSGLAAAAYRLERLPTAPCALRVRAGADTFDASYVRKLADLTGGALAGEPVPGGGDDVFLRVLDEAIATVAQGALTYELTSQAAWRWQRWNVISDELTLVTELEPSTADVAWFQVDGRVFGTETKTDYSETTLIELTAAGGPVHRLTAPGFLHGVARIR